MDKTIDLVLNAKKEKIVPHTVNKISYEQVLNSHLPEVEAMKLYALPTITDEVVTKNLQETMRSFSWGNVIGKNISSHTTSKTKVGVLEESFLQAFDEIHKSFIERKNKKDYIEVYKVDFLWKRIEAWIVKSKAKQSVEELCQYLEQYKDDFQIDKTLKLLDDLKKLSFSNKSFINFIRYYPVLGDYLVDNHFSFATINNLLRLHIWSNSINLILHFREDYILDFYSYDNDEKLPKERLIYNLSGTFSSSSTFRKSYKIERLLSILDKEMDEFDDEKNKKNVRVIGYKSHRIEHVYPLFKSIDNKEKDKILYINNPRICSG